MTKSPNDRLQETVGKLYEKMELDAYAKGFAAGLEAAGEMFAKARTAFLYSTGEFQEAYEDGWYDARNQIVAALRERAREEKDKP